jgi:tetratricopeptide (TPR) repeat protein
VEFWEQSPGEVLGHFRLLAPLGAGGFGRVWQALDLKLEREVAIKVLAMELSRKPGSRALLETEARTVARLKHPGIVTLHALEEVDGHLLLVMERIEGTTLEGLIPPQGMPLDQLLDLSLQMCEALGAAHGQGIIHRDLNPRNLMVTGEGRVKILDFGLALHQAATQPLPVQGRSPGASDGLTGTLPYLAPEQLEGRLLDARSDLFSLGVVLYEMATGSRPFHASSMVEQIKATLRTEPLWPPTLPSGWTAVLKRCLDKDPDQRFASCQELHHALKQVAARPPEAATAMAVDLEAYEDYLRGRQYYARYNRHGMRFAMQMFQQALDREPRFAAAWAGIANCAAFLYIYADRSEANRAQADAASTRALELDPTLAEAHASRGVALSAAGQMEAAEAAFLEALRLDPNLYEGAYFYARHCLATGQLACAAASFEAAARVGPRIARPSSWWPRCTPTWGGPMTPRPPGGRASPWWRNACGTLRTMCGPATWAPMP